MNNLQLILQEFNLDKNALYGLCIAAGSSVLQSILNERWKDSDIDLYCHIRNFPKVNEYLLSQGYIQKSNVYSRYPNGFLKRNKIQRVTTYKKNTYTVQVMSIRHSKPLHDVIADFDLTCCSVSCDFQNILYHGVTQEEIMNKVGRVRDSYATLFYRNNHLIQNRFLKYENRGFTLTPPNWSVYHNESKYQVKIISTWTKIRTWPEQLQISQARRAIFNAYYKFRYAFGHKDGYDSEEEIPPIVLKI